MDKKEFWSKLCTMDGEEKKEFWLKVFRIYSIYMIICLVLTGIYYLVFLKMISKQQKSVLSCGVTKDPNELEDEFDDLDISEEDWD